MHMFNEKSNGPDRPQLSIRLLQVMLIALVTGCGACELAGKGKTRSGGSAVLPKSTANVQRSVEDFKGKVVILDFGRNGGGRGDQEFRGSSTCSRSTKMKAWR